MKRKIELPNIGDIYHKRRDGIELTVLENLFCELDDDSLYIAALQQAYDQGYEDAKPKWLPIESAPKEIENRIIARNGLTVVTCYWNGANWINERSAYLRIYPATHWMPLPEIE